MMMLSVKPVYTWMGSSILFSYDQHQAASHHWSLPFFPQAPQYFAGAVELGVISQSTGAFNHILMDLSVIVNQFEYLSSFSAGIERLSSFLEAMRKVDSQRSSSSPLLQVSNNNAAPVTMQGFHDSDKNILAAVDGLYSLPLDDNSCRSGNGGTGLDGSNRSGHSNHSGSHSSSSEIDLQRWTSNSSGGGGDSNATALQIQNMDLVTPDQKRVLIRNLNVHLLQGQHLLIVGNSGTGKSSLLRAIAGLWTAGSGRIGRPADDDVYFLPQRPYCTLGSLKDQLLYPSLDYSEEEIMDLSTGKNGMNDVGNMILPKSHWLKQTLTEEDLLHILEKVDLLDVAVRAGDGDPAKGLAAVMDWSNMLSLGEQQRLAFGRLLVNRPKLVIVDEATSALDLASEARMYKILQEMAEEETVVSNDGKQQTKAPGLTYISVGHRPSLVVFHDKKLRLGGEQTDHELSDIAKLSVPVLAPTNL